MTHPIFVVISIVLAVAVILCLFYEPALIRWEDKQIEKIKNKYRKGKAYRK